ncbi:Calcineurin-like phosphoesterase [anaerobic digester metagenome]
MRLFPNGLPLDRFLSVTLVLGAVMASLGAVAFEPRSCEVTHLEVQGAPDGIVFIADPHLRDGNLSQARTAVEQINALKPALVLIGGDFVFGKGEDLEIHALWSEIDAPVYAVLGNHDYHSGDHATSLIGKMVSVRSASLQAGAYDVGHLRDETTDLAYADEVEAVLEQHGVHVLRNEVVELEVGGTPVRIVGVDDGWAGMADPPALEPGDAFTIYMAHEPECIGDWDADLVLAGHTHGGQFLPAGVANRVGLSGESRRGTTTVYVTRGIGTSNLPWEVRAAPPEIVWIGPN